MTLHPAGDPGFLERYAVLVADAPAFLGLCGRPGR
jgi:hypothetical protein